MKSYILCVWSESEEEHYHAFYENEYCPEPTTIENEESDAEFDPVIEHHEEFDSARWNYKFQA